ncbi:MAG TPA: helix-turn-helix domain-containing protein [Pseudonocardiaceae bacterium]|jgi:predicted DNA-binding transcriptional regulator AlpA|nr:helix-turn-helix domain-containing protein [Pseudonocardiaceae bacterium]
MTTAGRIEIPDQIMEMLKALAATIANLDPIAPNTRQSGQLKVADVCAELRISPRTFNEWRAKGRAPKCLKLPNGELRIRRADFDSWLNSRQEAA